MKEIHGKGFIATLLASLIIPGALGLAGAALPLGFLLLVLVGGLALAGVPIVPALCFFGVALSLMLAIKSKK